MSSTVLELTDATFDEEIAASPIPVLVEFWAAWCPPCRLIAPILDSIAAEYADRLRVCKVNSDERPELAQRYGVMSVPTILVFSRESSASAWWAPGAGPACSKSWPAPSAPDPEGPAVLARRIFTDVDEPGESHAGFVELPLPLVQCAQFGACRPQDGVRGVPAVLSAGEACHLGEGEPKLLGPGDELQPPEIGRGVLPVARRGARRLAQEPAPLVVPDRLDMYSRLVRELTDGERLHDGEATPRTGVRSQAVPVSQAPVWTATEASGSRTLKLKLSSM